MARSPVLGGAGLSPFGSSGVNFGAFDIAADSGEQAYLIFRRLEIEWEQGKISNATYLGALDTYAQSRPEGADRVNAQQRYTETKYRVERNTLVADIEDGKKEWDELLAYDQSRLAAIPESDSSAYDEQVGRVRQVQGRIFGEEEDAQRQSYSEGKMTSAQLMRWYEGALDGPLTADNPELEDGVNKRIDSLADQVIGDRDQKFVADYNAGKVGNNEFLAYANAARGRYAKGTGQYDQWTERISDTNDRAIETSLTYRYGLSQRYEQLAKFVKDNSTPPTGSTSTSTRKGKARVIWTGSGWQTVIEGAGSTTKTTGPSPAALAAWKDLQIQVADAKVQMGAIQGQVSRQPGGWVTTPDMIRYYAKIQGKSARGTPEWYNIQERIDGLNSSRHAQEVLAKQGIVVSYPKVGSEAREYGTGGPPGVAGKTPAGVGTGRDRTLQPVSKTGKAGPSQLSNDRDLSIDEFMSAIAQVESSGRYDAVNKSSGARGKYQIMPANWPSWAGKYLGDARAEWSPANQEKVAKGKFEDLYKVYGDWRAVAHAWLTGTGGGDKERHLNPNNWSGSSRSYVNKVFGGLGLTPTQVSSAKVRSTPSATSTGQSAAPPGSGSKAARPTAEIPPSAAGRTDAAPINIPPGLDGRQYERFYQRFLTAYADGQEAFVDFSSGRAVSYFVPMDLNSRSELLGYLDEVRTTYFLERANAYAGTPSEDVAMTAFSDATKQAGQNQLLILSTVEKLRPHDPNNYGESTVAGALNPLAAGLRMKAQTEKALIQYASAAKAAFARGDDEMAYALGQQAENLVVTNTETLMTYYTNAQAAIKAVRAGTGAVLPEVVKSDLEKLFNGLDLDKTDDGKVSEGYSQALGDLDKVAVDFKKFVKLDPNGEPVRRQGATDDDDRFELNPGVDLYLKPDGSIEHRLSPVTGFKEPGVAARADDKFVTVSALTGSSTKQVKAPWVAGVIGFIKDSGIPVMGKIVTGTLNGEEYMGVENPFMPGKWIRTNPGQSLSIAAPVGLEAYTGAAGQTSLQFSGPGTGQAGPFGGKASAGTFRLEFNDKDGLYHVFEAPTFMGGTEWKETPLKQGSDQLMAMLSGAGWEVDKTPFKGDDAYFFNSTGFWPGFTQKTHEQATKNLQSPQQRVNYADEMRTTDPRRNVTPLAAQKGAVNYADVQRNNAQRTLPKPFEEGKAAAQRSSPFAIRPGDSRVEPPASSPFAIRSTPTPPAWGGVRGAPGGGRKLPEDTKKETARKLPPFTPVRPAGSRGGPQEF